MATTITGVNSTLQKLIDAIVSSIVRNDGSSPTSWTDRQGNVITITESKEVLIEVRINPDGQSAKAKVLPIGCRAEGEMGPLSLTILATKLV